MRRYLLDSNAVNAFMNHREPLWTRVREARLRGDRIGTCEPVVAELFHGLEFSSSRDANIVRLNRALSQMLSWLFDRDAARQCGQIMADLQRRGLPIQMGGHDAGRDCSVVGEHHRGLVGQRLVACNRARCRELDGGPTVIQREMELAKMRAEMK